MLIESKQVNKAMNLSLAEVCEALANAGYRYSINEISKAKFKGFNGAGFVYEITFPSPEDDGYATGNVYVTMRRKAFSSDIEFYAEY